MSTAERAILHSSSAHSRQLPSTCILKRPNKDVSQIAQARRSRPQRRFHGPGAHLLHILTSKFIVKLALFRIGSVPTSTQNDFLAAIYTQRFLNSSPTRISTDISQAEGSRLSPSLTLPHSPYNLTLGKYFIAYLLSHVTMLFVFRIDDCFY